MKVVIIGFGVQGKKRYQVAESDVVATVDPVNTEANYRDIKEVDLKQFDAALVCLPDDPKLEVIRYLLENSKHVLVEKPLKLKNETDFDLLQQIINKHQLVCYTAYNHRFEPSIAQTQKFLQSGKLGKLYYCRLFYGNGTAQLVKQSSWRDQGAGVVTDLASHLLDIIDFWFEQRSNEFTIVNVHRFETQAPDHAIIINNASSPVLEFEVSLLSWRNHFTCDLIGEKGSIHLHSLCKWGPADFIYRARKFLSGVPDEEKQTLTQTDPTWKFEYNHFKNLIMQGHISNLNKDKWIYQQLSQLSATVIEEQALV